MAHLWCDAPMPADYMEVVLCRDVYHCPPEALDRIPMSRLLRHLNALGAEAEVVKARSRR